MACGHENQPDAQSCAKCEKPLDAGTEETLGFIPPVEIEAEASEAEIEAKLERGAVLVVKKGPDAGERFVLLKDETTLGRDPQSDIFLNDITVSRKHARVERKGTTVRLADVGSLNGTYVNGERVDDTDLRNGDEIQIGKFKMVFLSQD
jgi:pSer/pThr/pTyr-binding forkhead associated (FHA) protein